MKRTRNTRPRRHRRWKVKRYTQKCHALESLALADHCQMCSHANKDEGYAPLEPAFNPGGRPMTLCRPCRIGSAELLQSERKSRIVALRALLRAANAALADWGSGDLLVSAADAQSLSVARDKARTVLGRPIETERPSVLITVGGGVAYLSEVKGDVDCYILDYDDLRDVPQDKREEVLANLSEKERAYLRKHPVWD